MKANQVGQDLNDTTPSADAHAAGESTLDPAAHGTGDTVNRLAAAATPAIHQLQDSVNASVDSISDSADQARRLAENRVEGLRGLVRERPLAAIAAATVVGLLVARLAR